MRNYLVVVDDSSESRLAQRFAARRASQTGGAVHLISIIEQQQFVAWGGVQATIEEEARQAAEGVAQAAATALRNDHNVEVTITVGIGDPAAVVRSVIAENFDIRVPYPEHDAVRIAAVSRGHRTDRTGR